MRAFRRFILWLVIGAVNVKSLETSSETWKLRRFSADSTTPNIRGILLRRLACTTSCGVSVLVQLLFWGTSWLIWQIVSPSLILGEIIFNYFFGSDYQGSDNHILDHGESCKVWPYVLALLLIRRCHARRYSIKSGTAWYVCGSWPLWCRARFKLTWYDFFLLFLLLHHVVLSQGLLCELHLILLVILDLPQYSSQFFQSIGKEREQEGFQEVLIQDQVPTLRQVRAKVTVKGLEHLYLTDISIMGKGGYLPAQSSIIANPCRDSGWLACSSLLGKSWRESWIIWGHHWCWYHLKSCFPLLTLPL